MKRGELKEAGIRCIRTLYHLVLDRLLRGEKGRHLRPRFVQKVAEGKRGNQSEHSRLRGVDEWMVGAFGRDYCTMLCDGSDHSLSRRATQ